MIDSGSTIDLILFLLFVGTQILYLLTFAVDAYLFSLPVNMVDMRKADRLRPGDYPYIVLLYPVLNELEGTMRTTFSSIANLDYPRDRYRVIAVPNQSDASTTASLRRLQKDFSFLEIMAVPPTTDPSWELIWRNWSANDKAYWWHDGPRAGNRDLPPKKTRQLIYAFYHCAENMAGEGDFLVNYIDADSAPPRDHFLAAAVGMQDYDVLQSTNVAGNLNASMAASWHAFDHMTWDGRKYKHLSANGRHPYWVLGKGLFYKASDLMELGGFHPWITIEDPEVGMRLWKNGRKLGIIEGALIEEVPNTIRRGITQRKRWVCGFFQSLGRPLDQMGFTRMEKFKAWMNFLPCMSLWVNAIGIPVGLWALVTFFLRTSPLPTWTTVLALINVTAYLVSLAALYWSTWKRTALVLARRRDRLWYMLKINPFSLMIWWLIWTIPLWIGWRMYRRDEGLIWERTEKIDANAELIRDYNRRFPGYQPAPAPALAAAPRESLT